MEQFIQWIIIQCKTESNDKSVKYLSKLSFTEIVYTDKTQRKRFAAINYVR